MTLASVALRFSAFPDDVVIIKIDVGNQTIESVAETINRRLHSSPPAGGLFQEIVSYEGHHFLFRTADLHSLVVSYVEDDDDD